MISWIKKYWPSGLPLILTGVIGFFAGQFFPVYFEYAETQRAEVASLVATVATKGDELEKTIRPLMLIAGDVVPPTAEPRMALDDKMLDLFQTLELAKKELPQGEIERQHYVEAMLGLKSAVAALNGSITGTQFVEAASRFKKARTDYEIRLGELEPTLVESIVRSF